MLVCYHEAVCPAEKLVHYLQCQGRSEGLHKQNMTVSIVSSKLLVRLQPNLIFLVEHQKPECPIERMDYCVQGREQSDGSEC